MEWPEYQAHPQHSLTTAVFTNQCFLKSFYEIVLCVFHWTMGKFFILTLNSVWSRRRLRLLSVDEPPHKNISNKYSLTLGSGHMTVVRLVNKKPGWKISNCCTQRQKKCTSCFNNMFYFQGLTASLFISGSFSYIFLNLKWNISCIFFPSYLSYNLLNGTVYMLQTNVMFMNGTNIGF